MTDTRLRVLVLAGWMVAQGAAWADGPPAPVVQEEAVDLDALDAEEKATSPASRPALATRVPEHDYDRRLLALPALLVLLLVWNVRWSAPSKVKP